MSTSSETTAGALREAIDVRRFPWIRPLVGAYANDFASVASLFAGDPADPAAWRQTIARVQRAPRDRARLRAIVEQQLSARGAPVQARDAAAALGDVETVAIVTGQQAGAFGGPLYSLLKAITAIQLARRVRAEHDAPAVAVFWVDAEDHDWEEVRGADVLDADFTLRHIALPAVDGAGTRPVGSLVLDAGVTAALTDLESALAPSEFTVDVLARLRAHYRPGAGMATACAGWLDDLLGRHGLIVFDASDAAAKPLVADVFAHELEHPSSTATLARAAGAAMARLGHAPQVEPAEDGVSLFYLDESGRRPIKRRDAGYAIGDAVQPVPALGAEARTHPHRFSPNVLLRPITQDRLFPTVCYVGGPSEIAYQAQLGGVYREFGVEAPLLYSRASATLLDSGALRFLERYHLPIDALHAQDDTALNALLVSQLPPAVEQALADTGRDIGQRAEALRHAVAAIDPTLAGAVDTTIDRMRETLKSLHGKIIQASKRKDETLRRQFMRTRALAFPGGEPQERVLNVAFFVNRYGFTVCDRLLDILPLDTGKHYIVLL